MNLNKKNNFDIIFIAIMSISVCVFTLMFFYNPFGSQINIFFGRTGDYMADFLNVITYSADSNPYTNPVNGLHEKGYFPFSYMIMNFFSRFFDPNGLHSEAANLGVTVMMLFFVFSYSIFFIQLYDLKSGAKPIKILSVIVIFFSSIFLYTAERGNIIIISVIGTVFYLANYNNKNKIIREIAFVALAIAGVIKGYPAVFGLLLIYEKRWIEALRTVIYALLLTFLPFLYFEGGFQNIPQLLENIKANTQIYRLGNFRRFGLSYFFIDNFELEAKKLEIAAIWELITKGLVFLSIIVAPFLKNYWKKVGILTCVLLMMPVNSALYNGLYLIPIIILFLNEKEHKKIDYVYLLLFFLFLTPIQIDKISLEIANITVTILWAMLIIEGIILAIGNIKGKISKKILHY